MGLNKTAALAVLFLANLALAQTVSLVSPPQDATLSSGDVTFVFNATDENSSALTCALSVDGAESAANITAANGTDVSVDVTGIAEGAHNWSVSCANDANETGMSEVRDFTVDLPSPPEVTLDSPADDATLNSTAVDFVFSATESENQTMECTLSIDGTANATANATSGTPVTIPVSGLSEGAHNWSVGCTDAQNETGESETRDFSIQLSSPPEVALDSPAENATLNSTTVDFLFTATEPGNESLNCTLSIDGGANASTAAASGVQGTISVSGLSEGAHTWSVSCTDAENETGTSQVRSFSIDLDADNDGVEDGQDRCPASVPDTMKLNPLHYGQLNMSTSAFEVGRSKFQSRVFDMNTTRGCTCVQIVQKLGIGKGHLKHGCSPGIMLVWASLSHVPDHQAGGSHQTGGSQKAGGKKK